MSDEGVGRPVGTSPSTEFFPLSGWTAATPVFVVTATISTASQNIHTADPNAIDVLYVQAFNNSNSSATVYAQIGTSATSSAIPLTLTAGGQGFLLNGVPVSNSGVVSVWCSTATNVVQIVGAVQRTYQ